MIVFALAFVYLFIPFVMAAFSVSPHLLYATITVSLSFASLFCRLSFLLREFSHSRFVYSCSCGYWTDWFSCEHNARETISTSQANKRTQKSLLYNCAESPNVYKWEHERQENIYLTLLWRFVACCHCHGQTLWEPIQFAPFLAAILHNLNFCAFSLTEIIRFLCFTFQPIYHKKNHHK